ncbi:hypothetical protein SARC_03965 [Sphaeroforma arctica JP610]|uniref:DNA polymerase delta catalytic subunit n=1 Tax=Sphaeroforma arctica JP610 TaxID=667725 RepID=A0A0L0G4G9_9EUKA|nr:hypothetical protein SARC_03965 [Sphaeroforma arctica JP610]KNC83789.1 hypothetical protein SARC_03965 [Sphaeroforma arctica JP610]|eukprot:XP_014157691.1 hypothetical protein SARC_03965 [Sphaeroforma arctica JP610]
MAKWGMFFSKADLSGREHHIAQFIADSGISIVPIAHSRTHVYFPYQTGETMFQNTFTASEHLVVARVVLQQYLELYERTGFVYNDLVPWNIYVFPATANADETRHRGSRKSKARKNKALKRDPTIMLVDFDKSANADETRHRGSRKSKARKNKALKRDPTIMLVDFDKSVISASDHDFGIDCCKFIVHVMWQILFTGTHSLEDMQTVVAVDDHTVPAFRIMALDIEAYAMDRSKMPDISAYTSESEQVLFALDGCDADRLPAIELRSFDTEPKLIAAFLAYIHEARINVITGCNTFGFDWEYILGRCAQFGVSTMGSSLNGVSQSSTASVRWSSSGAGVVDIQYLKMPGIM